MGRRHGSCECTPYHVGLSDPQKEMRDKGRLKGQTEELLKLSTRVRHVKTIQAMAGGGGGTTCSIDGSHLEMEIAHLQGRPKLMISFDLLTTEAVRLSCR